MPRSTVNHQPRASGGSLNRRIIPSIAVALMLGGAAGTSAAVAQEQEPAPAWSLLVQRPGLRYEVDTLAFVQTGEKSYRFLQRVSLEQPSTSPAGERYDRVESVSDYDCSSGR